MGNNDKKLGVIFFHKNIREIYSERWIKKSVESMLNQSIGDFKIYEINYGPDNFSIAEYFGNVDNEVFFVSKPLKNHAEAMNFIIDKAFSDGCDYVFNTNLDDCYHEERIEKQITKLDEGYDIVTSDFCYIEEIDEEDRITHYKNIKSNTDIVFNLAHGHNVIAHPVVAYSKKFWESNRYNIDEIPMEDLRLWQRAIASGSRFYIMDDVLLFYRLHSNQITGNNSTPVQHPQQSSRTSDKLNTDLKNTIY
jgi:hypothetical protein